MVVATVLERVEAEAKVVAARAVSRVMDRWVASAKAAVGSEAVAMAEAADAAAEVTLAKAMTVEAGPEAAAKAKA